MRRAALTAIVCQRQRVYYGRCVRLSNRTVPLAAVVVCYATLYVAINNAQLSSGTRGRRTPDSGRMSWWGPGELYSLWPLRSSRSSVGSSARLTGSHRQRGCGWQRRCDNKLTVFDGCVHIKLYENQHKHQINRNKNSIELEWSSIDDKVSVLGGETQSLSRASSDETSNHP